MDAVNHELLSRLRVALDREMAITVGLAGQINDATRELSIRHGVEHEAHRQLLNGPDRHRVAGLSPAEATEILAEAMRGEAGLREDRDRQERAAGRKAATEQAVMRDHAAAVERAGGDPGLAGEIAGRAMAQANRAGDAAQALRVNLAAAVRSRVGAETHLNMLEGERSAHGRRAGLLRTSVQQAETWMRANGIAMAEAA